MWDRRIESEKKNAMKKNEKVDSNRMSETSIIIDSAI